MTKINIKQVKYTMKGAKNKMTPEQQWIDRNLQSTECKIVGYSYKDKEIYEGEEVYQDGENNLLLFDEIGSFLSDRSLKKMAEMIIELDDEPYEEARKAMLEIIKDNYTEKEILEWFDFRKVVETL